MKSGISLGIVALGLLLLALSAMWSNLFPATSTWTHEKAVRSGDVKARLAYVGGIVNSPNGKGRSGAELAKAKEEFDALSKENAALDAEFNSADQRPRTMSGLLKWSGISLAAVGVIGWYAASQSR